MGMPFKLSDDDKRAIREARSSENPPSLLDLAVEYDVSTVCIHRYVADIPPPPGGWPGHGRPRKFDWEQARKLEAQGVKRTIIAKRLGVSRTAITRVLGSKRRYTQRGNDAR